MEGARAQVAVYSANKDADPDSSDLEQSQSRVRKVAVVDCEFSKAFVVVLD